MFFFFVLVVYSIIATGFCNNSFCFLISQVCFHVLCTIHAASQHHTSATTQLKSSSCKNKKKQKQNKKKKTTQVKEI